MKVLIAEDSQTQRQLLTWIVGQKGGHEVITVVDGARALSAIQTDNPDLIILDVNMPGLNGREVYYQLKADAETARIPVIILTAQGNTDFQREVVLGGIDVFMTKPVKPDDLMMQINALMQS